MTPYRDGQAMDSISVKDWIHKKWRKLCALLKSSQLPFADRILNSPRQRYGSWWNEKRLLHLQQNHKRHLRSILVIRATASTRHPQQLSLHPLSSSVAQPLYLTTSAKPCKRYGRLYRSMRVASEEAGGRSGGRSVSDWLAVGQETVTPGSDAAIARTIYWRKVIVLRSH